MLEVQHIHCSYRAHPALTDVSLHIPPGSVVTVLGANGAGKTTLLCVISGLLIPSSGSISFAGQSLAGLSVRQICGLGIIHVPEGRQLFPHMTVRENLELGAYLPTARRERARNLAFVFHLFPLLETRTTQLVGTMSGGEQQMVAIGRGIMASPRLLMLDEPTLGLAPQLARAILQALHQWQTESNLAMLLVSQEVVQALQLATYGYVLAQGRLVRHGPSAELLHDAEIRAAYLGL